MAIIQGITKDKHENILTAVSIELKNEDFQTVYSAISDEQGHFVMTVPDAVYPFLTAVRDYATDYLEYWSHNVPAYGCLDLDIEIDTLEIYGIHAFEVKGAAKTLSIWFRPMSLRKFQAQEKEIAPDFDMDGIVVKINEQPTEVVVVNRVNEYIGEEGCVTAYLIQAKLPKGIKNWSRVDLRLKDLDGHIGAATLFREGFVKNEILFKENR